MFWWRKQKKLCKHISGMLCFWDTARKKCIQLDTARDTFFVSTVKLYTKVFRNVIGENRKTRWHVSAHSHYFQV